MTPLERLMAEGVPDGTFGASRPAQARLKAKRAPTGPDPRAAEHRAALLAAISRKHRPAA
ncbi:hypothetical protein N4G70_29155 [Streptomyces sp. ASQP_92]|uniref:hypothetical protein n=1 Tax=Streptomyces sp. ASQP_92 TaxID=2979116 RepID=UPI0021BEBA89|nr:hypothetical protein [Streptomyces sp. ASQP_92]MCT9092910.1 hypothetical protein [Streptomyces sp. ASQP_92]